MSRFKLFVQRLQDGAERSLKRNEKQAVRAAGAVALLVTGAAIGSVALIAIAEPRAPAGPSAVEAGDGPGFSPPPTTAIPDGPAGDAIRRGQAIFDNPALHAAEYVGNAMACRNCHLDSGRRAGSSPMWAAWGAYPQYRRKTGSINTMEDRIIGCFAYSMNASNSPSGGPPPAGSDVNRDLQAYFHWLATGAPTGRQMAGGGYPEVPLPASGYDPGRGAPLYEQKCSGCHGSDGQGAAQPDGKIVYPPLWGGRSFNWGAGMARVDLAARFIKGNMPLDQPGTLSDQEAWDIAAYMDSQERPKDPRQTGSVAVNAAANFAGQHSFYGKMVNGKLLGSGTPPQRR